jgi:cytochrome c oxidase assembly protein subunit 15
MATADIVAAPAPDARSHRGAVRVWLLVVAAMIFGMVVLGGATRLTESGLSIVEWKPVTGALPPLSEGQWRAAFDEYKTIPQYELLNRGMTLGEFKVIYWWEWSHRQLGRLIGIAFALPMIAFWLMGWLDRRLKPRLVALLALGGSQGALGWWMVASGLADRTDVSQVRLAMHMTLACIILSATLWVAQGLSSRRLGEPVARFWRLFAYGLVPLVLVQIFLGGLVAGLNAGLAYNTWPLMDGHLVPPAGDLWIMHPAWLNHFENALTVQFQHRVVAYVVLALALWQAVALTQAGAGTAARRARIIFGIVLVQAALGITTLVLVVPLGLALAHQAVAVALLAATVVHARAIAEDAAGREPRPMRQAALSA